LIISSGNKCIYEISLSFSFCSACSVAYGISKLWGIVPHSTEKCGGHTFTLQYDVPKRIHLFYVQAFLTAIVRSKTEVEKIKYGRMLQKTSEMTQ
jgi:hypothetical protein